LHILARLAVDGSHVVFCLVDHGTITPRVAYKKSELRVRETMATNTP
jgi:hypothetical protein